MPELLNESLMNSGVGEVSRHLYIVSSVAVYHTQLKLHMKFESTTVVDKFESLFFLQI